MRYQIKTWEEMLEMDGVTCIGNRLRYRGSFTGFYPVMGELSGRILEHNNTGVGCSNGHVWKIVPWMCKELPEYFQGIKIKGVI